MLIFYKMVNTRSRKYPTPPSSDSESEYSDQSDSDYVPSDQSDQSDQSEQSDNEQVEEYSEEDMPDNIEDLDDLVDNFVDNFCKNILKPKRTVIKPPAKKKRKLEYQSDEKEYLETLEQDVHDQLLEEESRLLKLINPNSVPLRFKIIESNMPETIKCTLLRKLGQVQHMSSNSGEYIKYKHWVESACEIPFGKYIPMTVDTSDYSKIAEFITKTKEHLDQTVYGHKDVKEQILRILSQWIAKPNSKGNVIGIYGEKGTGKTKIIKEGISKVLGLPFSFITLGGANDGSFLEGHGFTYEGSTYGKIAELLMKAKCMNPVIFFDELDKVSSSRRGDEIIGILTHMTDPIQNEKFNDKYFTELDIDMSKCLMVFSYNDPQLINPILKDRMITIKVSGYSQKDKIVICQQYLINEVINEFGFNAGDITINTDAVIRIIQRVPEEEGVRNLKRGLESIISWLNMKRFLDNKDLQLPFEITVDHVEQYVKKDSKDHKNMHMYI